MSNLNTCTPICIAFPHKGYPPRSESTYPSARSSCSLGRFAGVVSSSVSSADGLQDRQRRTPLQQSTVATFIFLPSSLLLLFTFPHRPLLLLLPPLLQPLTRLVYRVHSSATCWLCQVSDSSNALFSPAIER